ncbi:group II intron reverse transcriptase/maturase [Natranaerobius trueperi]|uniref:Group II intron reverse transcriptase/maturase n=2 Tax=Natranaerobius trueperi TaxID=759412 RepID=A0A226BX39_9FIRM|nr:group II intron reverse transcriptase/maturase [Natranaerobius trueperi]
MVEPESTKERRSTNSLEPSEKDGAESLLDKLLHTGNLNSAYKKVKQNRGAAGVDGMTVDELMPYLKENKDEFLESLRSGKYKPHPVRRVEIPKPDGGVKLLGVTTVVDRMVQQALVQILQPIFEPTFSDNSFGFRPNRNAQQAIKRSKDYYAQGYKYAVDIDLAKYFDTVNHDLLIGMVREQVKDETIIRLIRKFLKSGAMSNGLSSPSTKGTPQGGKLSPLLSNIYLNNFDRLLEKRGHKFVRYADDCVIYVKSKRAAERVMTSCTKYLEEKLKLKVNRDKSKTGSPLKLKFLGFSLYKVKGKVGIRPHQKTVKRFKDRVRQITSRKRGRSTQKILKELKTFTTGWLGYFSIADMKNRIPALNEWIRRRIRMYLWKQWKKISARFKNLKRLGITKGKAWEWANNRKGYWRIANSWILSRSLTNECLASIGYDDISNLMRGIALKPLNR